MAMNSGHHDLQIWILSIPVNYTLPKTNKKPNIMVIGNKMPFLCKLIYYYHNIIYKHLHVICYHNRVNKLAIINKTSKNKQVTTWYITLISYTREDAKVMNNIFKD